MKIVLQAAAVAAFAMACSSCSLPGDGHGGGGMTAAQCKEVYVKGMTLQGTPEAAYAEWIDQAAQGCAEADALSKQDYDCAVKATTLDEYTACKIVLDFS
jgi:hypothetical protein